MFWTFMNSITDAFFQLGDYVFDIFDTIGATSAIVGLAVVSLLISFVVLNHVGVLSHAGSSDKVSKRSENHVRDNSRHH